MGNYWKYHDFYVVGLYRLVDRCKKFAEIQSGFAADIAWETLDDLYDGRLITEEEKHEIAEVMSSSVFQCPDIGVSSIVEAVNRIAGFDVLEEYAKICGVF